MRVEIREASPVDSEAISAVILRALRETNASDYSPEIIERVAGNFVPDRVRELIDVRDVFVALLDGEIVGTASLEGSVVRTMFVNPDHQYTGIGSLLMCRVEEKATSGSHLVLQVPSSISAEGFYRKLGFVAVRDEFYGDERTIFMEKYVSRSKRSSDNSS